MTAKLIDKFDDEKELYRVLDSIETYKDESRFLEIANKPILYGFNFYDAYSKLGIPTRYFYNYEFEGKHPEFAHLIPSINDNDEEEIFNPNNKTITQWINTEKTLYPQNIPALKIAKFITLNLLFYTGCIKLPTYENLVTDYFSIACYTTAAFAGSHQYEITCLNDNSLCYTFKAKIDYRFSPNFNLSISNLEDFKCESSFLKDPDSPLNQYDAVEDDDNLVWNEDLYTTRIHTIDASDVENNEHICKCYPIKFSQINEWFDIDRYSTFRHFLGYQKCIIFNYNEADRSYYDEYEEWDYTGKVYPGNETTLKIIKFIILNKLRKEGK